MKLYFSPGACALATQIVLRELGQVPELVKVDLRAKTSAEGDFWQVNPKGYVPALRLDSGEVLTEGAIIMQYLADQHPEKGLFPKPGTTERYKAMEVMHFIATEIHKGFSVFFNATVAADEKVRASLLERFQLRLKYADSLLAGGQFLLGSQFSIADAYLYNVLRWTRGLKIDISSHRNLLGFMERMETRPTVKAAVEAEGIPLK